MSRNCFTFIVVIGLGGFLSGGQIPAATPLDASNSAPSDVRSGYQVTSNGQWVVYQGSNEGATTDELYCVPTVGGVPVRLNDALTPGGEIKSWQLSADGSRVVYLADQDQVGLGEVFAVSMPNGAAQKISDELVDKGSTRAAMVGTAGNRVAYIAAKVTGDFTGTFYEIFSVPTSGGTPIRLNAPLTNGGDVLELVARSDGGRVIYLADQDVDERIELYSAAPDGGSMVKLNGPLANGGDVLAEGLGFSPDGSRVLYAADQGQDQRNELYSVPTLGGTAVRLSGTMVNAGDVTRGSQRFSPNGARVLYHADQLTDEVFEIFSVPSTGGTATRLNGALVTGGDVKSQGLQFSPDSGRVLYVADQLEDETFELFSVPSAGGTAINLSGAMVEGGDVEVDASFSPDGSRVLFRADRRLDDVVELFSTPGTGGAPQLLSAPLATGGDVVRASYSPDGGQIVYLADQDVDEVFELYAVAAAGGLVRKISGPIVPGGDVVDWQFSPDGSRLIYRADQDIDDLFQLYAVDLSGALPGDFNRDGVVDAADYTEWRDGLGSVYTANDYTTWTTNFGRRTGAGASALGFAGGQAASIPEPASVLGLLAAMCFCGCHRVNRANPAPPAAPARILP